MRTGAVIINIDCELDAEYFGDWDSLTPEIQAFWNDHECNCEGSGVLSSSCYRCPFCDFYEETDANEY